MHLDWHQLLRALQLVGEGQYGLNPDTGRVRFFDPHELSSEDPRELWEEARFLMVEPLPEWRYEEWISAFAEDSGAEVGDGLVQALHDPRPLAAVRRLLQGRPALLQTWQEFFDGRLHECAEEWVAEHGLEPANPPPWRA